MKTKNKSNGKYEGKGLKLFCSRKSETAVEFLMTYGWALLLIIVILGALASVGLLDPVAYFTESKCRIYGGFRCTDFKIDSSERKISLVVRNTLGFEARDAEIKINSDSCTRPDLEGAVLAVNGISIGGNSNTINGGAFYGTTFSESGSGHSYNPEPELYTGELPVYFRVEDYMPGGSAALKAQSQGKYTFIDGSLDIDEETSLDGLYYVTKNVNFDDVEDTSSRFTIVAKGKIHVSGEDNRFTAYAGDLLFFSNATGNNAIKIAGSGNTFTGYIYAPNGEIEETGSGNVISGGLFSSEVNLGGNGLMLNFIPLDILRSDTTIPDPWENGQTVYLSFTCLGKLQRSFKGSIDVEWNTEYNWQTQYAGKHTGVGVIEGKAE